MGICLHSSAPADKKAPSLVGATLKYRVPFCLDPWSLLAKCLGTGFREETHKGTEWVQDTKLFPVGMCRERSFSPRLLHLFFFKKKKKKD